jgi:hypothetical protein
MALSVLLMLQLLEIRLKNSEEFGGTVSAVHLMPYDN